MSDGHKPKVFSANDFNVEDFLKDSVTLPEDEVTIYGDGRTAWEYHKLGEEREALLARIEMSNSEDVESIVSGSVSDEDAAELEALDKRAQELLEVLKKSSVTFRMRSLYPEEYRSIDEQANRETNKKFKGQPTPSEDEKDTVRSDEFLVRAFAAEIQMITLANGNEVNGPFSHTQIRQMMGKFDSSEWARLIDKHIELNTRRAIRDAQVDAGFPS